MLVRERVFCTIVYSIVFLSLGFSFSSCNTMAVKEVIPEAEKIRRDRVSGGRLAEGFESHLQLVQKDSDLLVYLRDLAIRLADTNESIKDAPIGVFIFKPKNGLIKNYSLPGNRFYLSLPFLKAISAENELAGALALEIGHIAKRHTLTRLEDLRDQGILPKMIEEGSELSFSDYFSVAGIFGFTQDSVLEAITVAVNVMYDAGYDPRGLMSYWNRNIQELGKSPYDRGALEKYLDKTRELIAKKSPLRNPVVRSTEFIQIKKRISKL